MSSTKLNNSFRTINLTFSYILFIVISLIVFYPLVYVVSAAFAPGNSIANLSIIPFGDGHEVRLSSELTVKAGNGFTLDHFKYLFTKTDYWMWFKNTFFVALWTTAFTVVISALSAYVFSRFKFAFKQSLLMSLLILQIFPSFVGMIAIYVILMRIGGLDTLWGLVLIYVSGNIPYNTWMVKSYMDTVSKNLDEAARIDGASHLRTFGTIILPVTRPIITFLAVSSFTGPWMDFIFPKMILRSPNKQTLALGLFSFVTDKKNEFTNFAAGALVVAIPFVIFFLFSQKAMMMSMSTAAVKE
ncbi:MAG: sugar ABC transporter permease [Treponema sp.]|nr:sugar ABC transporter permease [Spirochaetia bacterium]MDD7460077.1 sugar ABC transporter permease [Spirochaetales bacterium]MDY5811065.1 sugar ABC transporter permease [Treponema sp.]MEE1181364.1 sugar ABC transporter permease [Treponema sp.]